MKKEVRITFVVDEEFNETIKEVAKEFKIDVSSLVRQALVKEIKNLKGE